jgi:hypothetical protein
MSIYRRSKTGPYWIRISISGHRIQKTTGTTDREAAKEFERTESERAWRELKLGDRSAVQWREAAAALADRNP